MKKEKVLKKINPLFLKGICHRGLHNDKFIENGMLAFKNALDNNMALELDIHLTKDNELVVIHDSELKRVTGKDGIVEDLTLKELKDNYKLLNGETIPSLKEVMTLINEQVPMVIELKVFRKNYVPLASRLKKELECVRDKSNYLLISFDPRALFQFKKSGYVRQLLLTTEKKYRYVYHFRHFFEGVDLDYKYLEERKARRYCKKHFSNIWTIESKEVFDKYYKDVDCITFQHINPNYIKEMLK